MKYQRDHEKHVLWHLERVVEELSELLERRSFDRLVVAGPEEATSEAEDVAAPRPRVAAGRRDPDGDRCRGRRGSSTRRSRSSVAWNGRMRTRLVTDALRGGRRAGHGSCGVADTLQALLLGAVHTLVLSDGLRVSGSECPNCGWMLEGRTRCLPDLRDDDADRCRHRRHRIPSDTPDGGRSRDRSRRRRSTADGAMRRHGRRPPLPGRLARGVPGLLLDPRRAEDRDGEGDPVRLSEACPKAPSRRQPGQQRGRGALQADQRGVRGPVRRREAQEVRRARVALARVRAGAAGRRGGRRTGAAVRLGATSRAAGGPGGGVRYEYRIDRRGRPARPVRRRVAVLGLLRDVLQRRRAPGAARARRRRPSRAATARRIGHRAPARDHPGRCLHGARRSRSPLQGQDGATRRIEVKIPPGVRTGSRIRVAGQGRPGRVPAGRPATCTWSSRSRPTRASSCAATTSTPKVRAPFTSLLLGGEAHVPTPDGRRSR